MGLELVGGDTKEKDHMEEYPRKKTLNCKFDLFSWVVIIMHVPKFDLVNSILARGIDFRMSIIMPYH